MGTEGAILALAVGGAVAEAGKKIYIFPQVGPRGFAVDLLSEVTFSPLMHYTPFTTYSTCSGADQSAIGQWSLGCTWLFTFLLNRWL